MKQQTFLGGVAILFIGGAIAKILGAIYRIPLTWILGAEGLGLYQLIFPVFSLLIVLSSSGMPTSISKMTANRLSNGDYAGVRAVFKVSLITMVVVGLVASILIAGLSHTIASLQGNTGSTLGYLGIAPAVFFVCVLSVFRGYFQGHSNMIPTALSQIFEQGGKLVFGLLFAYLFLGYGIEWGAFGAILGVTISEILTVAVLCIFYLKSRKKEYNSSQNVVHSTKKAVFLELIRTSTPIVLTQIVLPLLIMLDSFLIVNLLSYAGVDQSTATILWGIDSGVVNSLVNMPIALCLAVAISIVPAVASLKDRGAIERKLSTAYTVTIAFCLPVIVAFCVLASPLLNILYNGMGGAQYVEIAKNLLLLGAPIILFGSLLQVQNSALQALGKGRVTMLNMILSGVVKVVLTLILVPIPEINIYGLALSTATFYILSCLFNAMYLHKLKFRYKMRLTLPSLAGAGMLGVYLLNIVLLPIRDYLVLILGIIGGAILYVFSLWSFGFDFVNLLSIFKKKVVKVPNDGNN